jgi:amino-acid N-acetyltransferase
LLRSIAVVTEYRGKHFGKAIVEDLIRRAEGRSQLSVSLLTETAPSFFEGLGFRKLPREDAPVEIKSSSEFSSVCPVSAVYMSMELGVE